jgi:uncharacterized membrane protein
MNVQNVRLGRPQLSSASRHSKLRRRKLRLAAIGLLALFAFALIWLVTETLRGLLTGAHIGTHAVIAVAWSVGIAAASYLWATRLYTQRQPR